MDTANPGITSYKHIQSGKKRENAAQRWYPSKLFCPVVKSPWLSLSSLTLMSHWLKVTKFARGAEKGSIFPREMELPYTCLDHWFRLIPKGCAHCHLNRVSGGKKKGKCYYGYN